MVAGALAALICIIVSVLVVVAVHDKDVSNGHEELTESTDRMLFHIRSDVFPPVLQRNENEEIQVLDPHGRIVTASRPLLGKPRMATFRPPAGEMRTTRTLCPPAGLKGCMTVVGYQVFQPDGWMIYTAIPVVPWYASSGLVIFLGVVSLLIIATMLIEVYRAVGRVLAPVDAIRVEMEEITASDLDRRVPVPKNQNEIRMLAKSVNTTLNRLEAAYEQLRRFTSDASHEVRSPLTAIRAQVEEALMYPDDTDWIEVAQAVLAGVDRLQEVVTDLLVLARLDAGAALTCESTDLAQVVQSELDRRPHRVPVVTRLQKGVFAEFDRLRITRLLTNLLDNAERHAISQITVTVRGDGGSAVLEVADDGTGIAVELREIVFKRFARLDASRNRDAGGSGLGLAIARQIAEVHGGTLTVEDSERGARFVLRLPHGDPPKPCAETDTAVAQH
jgi:signal transduction histidine kinase